MGYPILSSSPLWNSSSFPNSATQNLSLIGSLAPSRRREASSSACRRFFKLKKLSASLDATTPWHHIATSSKDELCRNCKGLSGDPSGMHSAKVLMTSACEDFARKLCLLSTSHSLQIDPQNSSNVDDERRLSTNTSELSPSCIGISPHSSWKTPRSLAIAEGEGEEEVLSKKARKRTACSGLSFQALPPFISCLLEGASELVTENFPWRPLSNSSTLLALLLGALVTFAS
mmetsp:Transcript_3042/g.10257  ORF Transcript_3042/g.10257 Transcript_3042/m.10257 type:complete len:231 (+) Transcript_3042:2495-3187(+)